jgi:hypothetical protein
VPKGQPPNASNQLAVSERLTQGNSSVADRPPSPYKMRQSAAAAEERSAAQDMRRSASGGRERRSTAAPPTQSGGDATAVPMSGQKADSQAYNAGSAAPRPLSPGRGRPPAGGGNKRSLKDLVTAVPAEGTSVAVAPPAGKKARRSSAAPTAGDTSGHSAGQPDQDDGGGPGTETGAGGAAGGAGNA